MESGCEIFQLKDIRDLEDYCYYVAGVVGVMLTRIFCQKESVERKRSELERFQIDFGLGLQLINIVKDYSKDIARGWCYIPHTVTDKHGIKLGDIRDLSDKQRQGVLRDMVPLVVPYLDSTLRYITLLPTAERSIRMFCIIPFVIAYKTLAKILNGEANKISRAEVASIREQSDACARSSSLLEEDYMNTKKHYFGIAGHVS